MARPGPLRSPGPAPPAQQLGQCPWTLGPESRYLTLSQEWRAREQPCLVHTETFKGSLFLQNLSLPPLKRNSRTQAKPPRGREPCSELSHHPAQDGREGEAQRDKCYGEAVTAPTSSEGLRPTGPPPLGSGPSGVRL